MLQFTNRRLLCGPPVAHLWMRGGVPVPPAGLALPLLCDKTVGLQPSCFQVVDLGCIFFYGLRQMSTLPKPSLGTLHSSSFASLELKCLPVLQAWALRPSLHSQLGLAAPSLTDVRSRLGGAG